ncbi:ATP-binding protein [Limosilactobacillus secaliphilus]|nr:ATP-binding protein [Limosilactobacillus secaliphilus]
MEILSPGGIPDGLTLDEIKDGMTAVRNPQLVHILDKMNYIENYGTGINRMFESYDGTGVQPEFKVTPHMFKVIFPNLNYNNKSKKVENNLSDADRIVLLLQEKGALSIKEISSYLGLTIYKTRKNVRELIAQKNIKKIGQSVNTKYKSR